MWEWTQATSSLSREADETVGPSGGGKLCPSIQLFLGWASLCLPQQESSHLIVVLGSSSHALLYGEAKTSLSA